MTATEATSFEGFSARSYQQIEEAIEARKEAGVHVNCECVPYEDTFTFNRWLPQGFCVKKGEKALSFSSFVPVPEKGKEGEEKKQATSDEPANVRLMPKTLHVFCRCSVAPIEPKK